jgi:L-2-hydroxycarboxylate dehydrogenase (NAD+)
MKQHKFMEVTMSTIRIPVNVLMDFMQQSLQAAGVPEEDARIVAEALIRSDVRGIESHGIGRLKMYLDFIKDKVQNPVTVFEILREAPGTALVDGHFGMGHVIAYRAMQLAIEKARTVGIGAVAIRNSTHFGIAGYYPLMAIKENMAGFAVTNARPSIAPTFGAEPMLGTNPIAFGVPTDEECPFLLDMATSITQRGKIEVAVRAGKSVPSGWAIDNQGNDLTDPLRIMKAFASGQASLLPLGGKGEETAGYKGYGLAVMVEILSAILSGGPFCRGVSGFDEEGNKVPNRLGHFFLAIDIAKFVDVEEFKKSAGALVRSLRSVRKLPGQERIYSAGEKEYENEQTIPRIGVPINDSLQKTMRDIKIEYDLSMDLPF